VPLRRIPISPNSHFAEISAISLRGGEGTGVLSHVPDSCDLKPAMQKLIEHPNFQHWLLGYSAPSRRSPMSTFPSPMNLRRLHGVVRRANYVSHLPFYLPPTYASIGPLLYFTNCFLTTTGYLYAVFLYFIFKTPATARQICAKFSQFVEGASPHLHVPQSPTYM
jgi:hypothetical protein